MKIFVCELGDRSHDHYLKGQLRAKKSVNTRVQLRTELCTLVCLFIYLLFNNAFNFYSSIMLWALFGPWLSSLFPPAFSLPCCCLPDVFCF